MAFCSYTTSVPAQQETSKPLRNLAEMERLYSESLKTLDAGYRREVKRLDKKYLDEVKAKREKLVEMLEAALRQATEHARLEDALKLGKKIQTLKEQAFTPPKSAVAEREFKLQQKINALKVEIERSQRGAKATPQIPDSATEFNGHAYLVVEDRVSHRVAALRAAESGGYLARIDDSDEQEFIAKLVQSGKNEYYIVDGTDDETPNEWLLSNGLPVPYIRWDSRQPEKKRGQWVLSINRNSGRNHDQFCAELLGYIIEWDQSAPQPSIVPTGERFFDVSE